MCGYVYESSWVQRLEASDIPRAGVTQSSHECQNWIQSIAKAVYTLRVLCHLYIPQPRLFNIGNCLHMCFRACKAKMRRKNYEGIFRREESKWDCYYKTFKATYWSSCFMRTIFWGAESKQPLMPSQRERWMGWIILFLHASSPPFSHEYLQIANTTCNTQEEN